MRYFWPAQVRYISSGMGAARPYGGHEGIDIAPTAAEIRAGKLGVFAIAPGQVTKVGYMPGGYGNYVVVRHPDGRTSLYGHLSRIGVREGMTVERGGVLGVMGATGMATGVHLHLSVRDPQGRYLNPLDLGWGAADTSRRVTFPGGGQIRLAGGPPRPAPRGLPRFISGIRGMPPKTGSPKLIDAGTAAMISGRGVIDIKGAIKGAFEEIGEKIEDRLSEEWTEHGPDLIVFILAIMLLTGGIRGLIV